MLKSTVVLDDIFNPAKGWAFHAHQVPLSRRSATDGNPYFLVTIDDIELLVFEQHEWKEGVTSNVPATRLVVKSFISGVNITNPAALAKASSRSNGLPSYGLDDDGDVTLQAALPFADNFPLEWLRKQVMVCMGLVAEEAQDFINELDSPDTTTSQESNFDWNIAKNVASVAGIFLGAFFEE